MKFSMVIISSSKRSISFINWIILPDRFCSLQISKNLEYSRKLMGRFYIPFLIYLAHQPQFSSPTTCNNSISTSLSKFLFIVFRILTSSSVGERNGPMNLALITISWNRKIEIIINIKKLFYLPFLAKYFDNI